MGIPSVSSKKLTRFVASPFNLCSLYSLSVGSPSKTMYSSFRLTDSHSYIRPIDTSTPFRVPSSGSISIRSIKLPFHPPFDSSAFDGCDVHFHSFVGLRICSFRNFSAVSADEDFYMKSPGTPIFDRESVFRVVGAARLIKSGPTKGSFFLSESYKDVKQMAETIDLIRNACDDLEHRLNARGFVLTVKSVVHVLRVLNSERIPALRFFRWFREGNANLYSSDVCSLVIHNCGLFHDYESILSLLKEFKSKKICINEKAFGFLPVFASSETSLKESMLRWIHVLNEVGGSCRNSGIGGLINMLCMLNLFDMAKFVIQITERKVSYFNILILDKCRRGQFDKVRGLLEEMRTCNTVPDVSSYNYMLGGLCKNGRVAEALSFLEEMHKNGPLPDARTFEIFIYFLCMFGRFQEAANFLEQMVSRGIEPRFKAHAAFIWGYILAKKYIEAQNYAIDVCQKYKHASSMIYNLLASVHHKKGDLSVSAKILIEMMDRGLRPNYALYLRTKKRLLKTGQSHLAGVLRNRFIKFGLESSTT